MEICYFSISDIDELSIQESNHKNRHRLLQLLNKKEKLLSTILIGNNLINLSASALNTALAIHYAYLFELSEEMAIAISTIILTITILIFGEIIPKTIAIYFNKQLALFFSPLMQIIVIIMLPISVFTSEFGRLFNKFFLFKKKNKIDTSQVLLDIVKHGSIEGSIDPMEEDFIVNLLHSDHKNISSIMTSRVNVFALDENKTIDEVYEEVLENNYTRIPLFNNIIDNTTGIINIKRILIEKNLGNGAKNLHLFSKKPIFVYESTKIVPLLEQFKINRSHLAIVVDEFGSMIGIVTLEDALEELVGEIFDEKDTIELEINEIAHHTWILSGQLDIQTFNKVTGAELSIEDDFETIQGLIMQQLQTLPKLNDTVYTNGFSFQVLSLENNQIKRLEAKKIITEPEDF